MLPVAVRVEPALTPERGNRHPQRPRQPEQSPAAQLNHENGEPADQVDDGGQDRSHGSNRRTRGSGAVLRGAGSCATR